MKKRKKNNIKQYIILLLLFLIVGTAFFTGYLYKVNASNQQYFSVLSYNVAALPDLLTDNNPGKNTKLISPLLNNYDIVGVQEDFAYHTSLISSLNLQYKTKHSGNVPVGDGMNIFSSFPITKSTRYTWEESSGIISNGSDQLTPKGILYTSIELESGYYLDVYDIHADADCDEDSYKARQSNMNQLANLVSTLSVGKAVIVLGDTNSRYTRSEDNFESAVLDTCNLKDPWIELSRNNNIPSDGDSLVDTANLNSANNEVVDKIWYRSGKNITLSANSYELLTSFIDSDGNQLSDHYPITAKFEYKLVDNIKYSDTYGGKSGTAFSFIDFLDVSFPTAISIRTDARVDNIGFTYDTKYTSVGGNGGTYKELKLQDGEYITSVSACKAKKSAFSSYRVSYIKFTTNLGNTLEGGTKNAYIETFTAPDGYAIGGLYGFAGAEIDSIGAIYKLLN